MMAAFGVSKHADGRMQQRGIRRRDIDLILLWGTSVDDGGILLRHRDVDDAIRQGERDVDGLRRACGAWAVYRDDMVVTCYRPTRKETRRAHRRLRHGPHRSCSGRVRRRPAARRSPGVSSRGRRLA